MQIPKRFADTQSQLHEMAAQAAGFDDFGHQDYRGALDVLLESFDEKPDRPEAGRGFCWGTLLGCLVARLHVVKGWRERPDCLQRAVPRPLIITGIPRTGTTALHKLLSMDPQFQGLEMWLTNYPQPRPPRETWPGNVSYRAMEANLAAFYEAAPQMRAMHSMVAGEVDECLEVLKHSFVSNRFGASFDLPGYDRWWLKQDERPAYRYYADVIRLIGADAPHQRWLLKNPGHVWSLGALLEVFPDACVVHTHRDPAKAIPSVCSTEEAARPLGDGPGTDPQALGRREVALWSKAMHRTMEVRKTRSGHFFDVFHHEFHADPLGVVRRIYQRFGLELSPNTEVKMLARIRADPERSHGLHDYTAEHFGLSQEGLREAFREYIDCFDLR
jgi:hypothetical protein